MLSTSRKKKKLVINKKKLDFLQLPLGYLRTDNEILAPGRKIIFGQNTGRFVTLTD